MKLNLKCAFIALWLFQSFCTFGQTSRENNVLVFKDTPLKEVIEELEAKYNIKFSYVSNIVDDKSLNGRFTGKDRRELIGRIFDKTDLSYQFIDDENVILNAKYPPKIQKRTKKESYSLKGKVVHSSTKEPIPFASIVVGDSGKGTVTDFNGYYELGNLTASKTKIFVHMVGFKKLEEMIDLEQSEKLDIELEEAFVELEGIEITPGLFNIQTAEPKAHQLSQEEITFSPNFARDIYRTLSLVPGVSNTEFSSKARIRGGHADETAIYIDNFEIYEPFHLEEFDGVFSVINTDFVEETKVLTGGFSPRYTDKISGIISVKTPDNISNTETKVSLDILNASIIRKQKISSKSSAFFGARRGYIDFILDQVDNDDDKLGIEPIFYDVWGKYNYQLNSQNLFSYNLLYSQDNFTMREQAIIRDDFFDSKRKGFYNWLNWKWLPSSDFYALTTVGFQELDKDSDFRFESSVSDQNVDNRNSKIFILNQNSIWDFHPDHSLEFGVEFKQFSSQYRYIEERTNRTASVMDNVVTDRFDLYTKFSGYTLAGYLQESYKLSPQITMMGGLRVSNQSYGDKTTIAPRTAISYQPMDKLRFNMAYGVYYQPDNFQKTRSFVGQVEPFRESSRSVHYTGSANYISDKTNLLLNVYYKDNRRLFDDYRLDFFNRIAGVGIIDLPFNTISGTSKGFEISARHQIKERHLLSVIYRYSKDRIKNAMGVETFRDFDRRHSITFNNVFKFSRNFTLSALWTYHTGQPYTPATIVVDGNSVRNDDTRLFYNVEEKNSERLPDYHTLNIKLDKSWIFKKIELNVYLNIVNFYNRGNIRNYTFDGESFNNNPEITVFRDGVEYFNRFITPGISVTF